MFLEAQQHIMKRKTLNLLIYNVFVRLKWIFSVFSNLILI